MVRDCREAKCFECGKFGHISPYCPGKQEKLRCASCGRFGHNKEECNTGNYNTRWGFPQRGTGQSTSTARSIERARVEGLRVPRMQGVGEQTAECFRCREQGHVARDCSNC
ncbi:DNA-binding protein HEXBP-like [Gordionus sp. m RMFG-2023]|uniref:DNA-binding protein HEXBP-like n=1 Tax=Gordionus sp. m RMFG-2023 TaxID=3053472 RepID=UPI0031FD41F5